MGILLGRDELLLRVTRRIAMLQFTVIKCRHSVRYLQHEQVTEAGTQTPSVNHIMIVRVLKALFDGEGDKPGRREISWPTSNTITYIPGFESTPS